MRMLDALVRNGAPQTEERSTNFYPWFDSMYPFTWDRSRPTQTDSTFEGMIEQVHKTNGIVSAAVAARSLLVSQIRFRYRRLAGSNRSGELWGDRSLSVLEGNGRTSLLSRFERDVSYAGNAYAVLDDDGRICRLAPDRVSFIMRSESLPRWSGDDGITVIPPDAEVMGIAYHAQRHGEITATYPADQYMHWAPEPDPLYWWRGESWVSSVYREIATDGQAVDHTSKFFDHAATPNMVFSFPPERSVDEIKAFSEVVNSRHSGSDNSFRNMFLAGGAEVTQVGANLEQLSLKDLTGGFETRIAARARIPGTILGVREGYAGSSLNAGNYGASRRMWADGWFAPTAESLCAALSTLVPAPSGSELHYDPDAVLFLQEDRKDAADILQTQAVTMRQLVEAGFDPASVVEAITTGDMSKLVHTGNVSVQLQPPGSGQEDSND